MTEAAGELLLYDTEKHNLHHLNVTTAAIWRLCDGRHDVPELARSAGEALGGTLDEATVRLALTKLDDAGLLAAPLGPGIRVSRMSRRGFMRRTGVAGAIAAPALLSTVIPQYASATTGNLVGGGDQTTSLSVSPSEVVSGEPVQVAMSGFDAGEPVTILLGETGTELVSTGVDGTGSGTQSVTIPEDVEPGGHSIVAVGGNSRRSAGDGMTVLAPAVEEPDLAPALWLSADAGYPGESVAASVDGFAAGEAVDISFAGAYYATTSNGGSVSITLPTEPGAYSVDAYGTGSGVSAETSWIEVLAPAPPADDETEVDTETGTEPSEPVVDETGGVVEGDSGGATGAQTDAGTTGVPTDPVEQPDAPVSNTTGGEGTDNVAPTDGGGDDAPAGVESAEDGQG